MLQELAPLVALSWRVTPAFVVGFLVLVALPRQLTPLRVVVYLLLFVVLRDAMTPLGLWHISPGMGSLRFIDQGPLLVGMGFFSLVLGLFTMAVEPGMRQLVVMWRGSQVQAVALGLAGAFVIGLPVLALQHLVPGAATVPVAVALWGPIACMALLGNFLEELFFRGYLQGHLEELVTPMRAALLSGLFFALYHSCLATTVTDLGAPVLLFTAYEGTLAALIRMRSGLVASTLAHGGGIFLLASF